MECIKINMLLLKQKCSLTCHLKPSWVPCGTKTSLWETRFRGTVMLLRFHMCRRGLDISEGGRSLFSGSVQMASAWSSGNCRLTRGTASTKKDPGCAFLLLVIGGHGLPGHSMQKTASWSHKLSTFSDGQWALERMWERVLQWAQ